MKKIVTMLCALTVGFCALAQDNDNKGNTCFGVSFNTLGLGKSVSQPEDGTGAGAFVSTTEALVSRQMNIMTQDPLANFRLKHSFGQNFNLRVGVGFSGSKINYREYVADDAALAKNPLSEKQVVDNVKSSLNTVSLNIGGENVIGDGKVKFLVGYGLNYVVGGGKLAFDYGNKMTVANPEPTTVGLAATPAEGTVNDFEAGHVGINWARPTERYSQGYCHGIGVAFDLGVEWFFLKSASLQLGVSMTPVMFVAQPQTWTKFEGYSNISGRIEEYTDLVSPGSYGVLYGTQKIGLNVGLNYYF